MRAKTLELSRASDAKEGLLKQIGVVDDLVVLNDLVLMASYIEPETTKGGIILTHKSLDESRYQGKVGLVLKKGPSAFKYAEGAFPYEGPDVEAGDWVIFRGSDAWELFIRGVPCRFISSDLIKAVVPSPEYIY